MALTLQDARNLTMEGSAALAEIEGNGMRMDVGYLDRMIDETGTKIRELELSLRQDETFRVWRRVFGDKSDLGSRSQLGSVIFDHMKIPCNRKTTTGRPATDDAALQDVDLPFVRRWNNLELLKRVRSTNLIGLRKETCNGLLHSSINLHTAVTYRSSTSNPNSQNIPIRDPKQSKLVRRAFIPRDGNVLIEVDYSGIEVRVASCYHEDPTMIEYIKTDHDLHLDMAAECYMLAKEEVSKSLRSTAKGGFVFAEFYGDWWPQVSVNLWKSVENEKTKSGASLKEHLRGKGITELGSLNPKTVQSGTFASHIKSVEEDFWGRRFRVYSSWKEKWWNQYLRRGWYQMLTGFISRGVFSRNEVINGGIQGSAFHCLLWSLIKLQGWLKANNMKSMIIGQIHDSIILDVVRKELEDVLHACKRIMTRELLKAWDWIIVPLEIEAEIGEENWHMKKPIAISE